MTSRIGSQSKGYQMRWHSWTKNAYNHRKKFAYFPQQSYWRFLAFCRQKSRWYILPQFIYISCLIIQFPLCPFLPHHLLNSGSLPLCCRPFVIVIPMCEGAAVVGRFRISWWSRERERESLFVCVCMCAGHNLFPVVSASSKLCRCACEHLSCELRVVVRKYNLSH